MNETGEAKILQRVSPHNPAAEKAVIACMLMDRDAVDTAAGVIRTEDFYVRYYGMMFDAIRAAAANVQSGGIVDMVTVQEQLAKMGAPQEMQSMEFLKDLYEADPVLANVKSYAEIVKNKSVQRSLIKICGDISQMCYEDSEETQTILEQTETQVFDLIKTGLSGDYTDISDIALDVFNRIQKASKTKDHITGVASGFPDLDYLTTGFQPSDFILLAARPSMGKTALALNILEYVALKKKRPCMVFSLEMSKEQLVNRLFAMDSGIDAQNLRSGKLTDQDWNRLLDTADRIAGSNIIIDDTPGISVTELRSKCRKVKAERGLDLVIIDYLQLMSASGRRNENRQQEVSEISRALKALARDIQCPVMALSQLSRAVETRSAQDRRPQLSDLRESGAIEQDADLVMFLYRDEYYTKEESKYKGEAELIIAKQRNGPLGTVNLYWQPATTRFVSKEKRMEQM